MSVKRQHKQGFTLVEALISMVRPTHDSESRERATTTPPSVWMLINWSGAASNLSNNRNLTDLAADVQNMLDAKRALLLGISHELRTPLSRMRLIIEFIDDDKQRQEIKAELIEKLSGLMDDEAGEVLLGPILRRERVPFPDEEAVRLVGGGFAGERRHETGEGGSADSSLEGQKATRCARSSPVTRQPWCHWDLPSGWRITVFILSPAH